MSLTRFQYECLTCDATFVAARKLASARCVLCGSLNTTFLRMTSQQLPERSPQLVEEEPGSRLRDGKDQVSKYICLDCGRPTRWNHTKREGEDPICSSCSSASVKEVSPRVSMLAVARGRAPRPTKTLSKSQLKRLRFVRRQWRMRCDLAEQIDGLENLLQRMGFEGRNIQAAREMMKKMLVEVDEKQQERLREYERLMS